VRSVRRYTRRREAPEGKRRCFRSLRVKQTVLGARGMLCPKCAFANFESAALCGRCGGALDSSRLITERNAQSSSHAERRRLSVMFCDLVGSTALSGQLDPEELHDLMRHYQTVCADVVGRHGGHVAQFLGDGLLVYFGYPIAHEDDAQRAVRAGLEIVAAISGPSARLAKSLQIRIAVHTGLAVVGSLGDGSDPDAMTIVGETPNIAARLQTIAEPGTVIISESTYRLIEGFFLCRSLGGHTLKGVAAPIELYSALEESRIQSRFEQAVAAGLTPFVSRETEVALLLERWERARDGAGQVILLSGEAGIGKSRLLRVLKERTAGQAVTDLGARCSPYYQDSALYPIIGFFQYFLQFQRDDSAETKLTALERALENFGFPLSETVPLLAALLSLPSSHRYPPLAMTPQRQKQKTLETLVAWLLREAERHPTRVVVEDVHWADPSTLEFLALLIDQVLLSRLFVALVFRSEFLPPWRSQAQMTNIALGRLSRGATESMIESIAGGKKLPPDLSREIAQKTDGIPLFVEELTRMVIESGMVREQDNRYELTSPLTALAIPSTLYESLMARLDRLGAAKEIAQIAAIIGKEFSYELLQAISPLDEAKLTGALNRLVDADVLEQYLLSPQTQYSFRHALIRDAAYESLLRSKRRQYHRKVAEVLQNRFAETVEAHPELLASHFAEAGLVEEAIPYWQRAGQRALERSSNQEAIRHLTNGLELLGVLPETPQHLQQELLLRVTLGGAVMVAKGFGSLEAQSIYARARKLCQQMDESPLVFKVNWALWANHAARGEHLKARESAEECLRLAHAAKAPELLLEAHHALGVSLLLLGEFGQGLEHLEQGAAMYDPRQHAALAYVSGQDSGVACLSYQAWALWFLGYPDQARRRIREALTLAHKLSHPVSTAAAANIASWVYQLLRDQQAAQEQAEEAVSLSIERGFELWRAMGMIGQGWALTEQEMVDDGIARLRAGLTALRSTGREVLMPYFLSLLAQAYASALQIEEGLNTLAESQVALDDGAERWWQAELYRLRGELILRRPRFWTDDEKEAEECFRRALSTAQEQRAKSLELRAATSLSRLWQRQGRKSEARRTLASVYDWFTEGFGTPDLQDARTLLEQLSRN
jgi:predicted ATPase/class 3 adenylate cyclase